MTQLEAGKYYYCTACGAFYKRSNKARRPYLPCGHLPEYIREITQQEYLARKLKGKLVSQGILETQGGALDSNNKTMKQTELTFSVLHYTLANLTISTRYATDIL